MAENGFGPILIVEASGWCKRTGSDYLRRGKGFKR